MPAREKKSIEFGDFQTPEILARRVCEVLRQSGVSPSSIMEPTCGTGAFLRASSDFFPDCTKILGFEINPSYVQTAKMADRAEVYCADFFEADWPQTLNTLNEPILVLGNPPWVTNSVLGLLDSTNLPAKSNFKRLNGFDAITGKSNFDISEWMLLHLLDCLSGRRAVLAMLCKTGVARKVLQYAWSRNLQISESKLFPIDAGRYFNASVDACLFVCVLEPGAVSKECEVFSTIEKSGQGRSILAFRDEKLIADLRDFDAYGHLSGVSPFKWRSGVKHDCASVMELRRYGRGDFENHLGEVINIEPTNLYPMLKSSDLMKEQPIPSRYMLVTQHFVGEDTSRIQFESPLTWQYLQSHGERLDRRRSSIYTNRPRFSVFAVGTYSFAPWKVATSGFSKSLQFHCVGPFEGKPVVFDDTCYFLPCQDEDDARRLSALLNSEAAKGFFNSYIFWDSKRPITAQILAMLDLGKLSKEFETPLPAISNFTKEYTPLMF